MKCHVLVFYFSHCRDQKKRAKRAKPAAANSSGRLNHTQLGGSMVAASKNAPASPTKTQALFARMFAAIFFTRRFAKYGAHMVETCSQAGGRRLIIFNHVD